MTTTSAPRVPVARRPAGVAAAAGTTWTAQLASWLHTHATSIVVVSVALGAIAVVHAWGMATFPARFDDEGTYVSQAWSLLTRGALSPYTYWYDHPPLGWMQLAGWFASTGALDRGGNAVTAGREAMLVAHLVSSGLLYVLARRLGFARGWSVVALVLYTASPLALSMHRMVFLDNLAMPWLIGAFVLACTPRHRLSAYAGAALPLLLYSSISGVGLGNILSSQVIAQEIVRTLVGSIGLIAAVPITTAVAALLTSTSAAAEEFPPTGGMSGGSGPSTAALLLLTFGGLAVAAGAAMLAMQQIRRD